MYDETDVGFTPRVLVGILTWISLVSMLVLLGDAAAYALTRRGFPALSLFVCEALLNAGLFLYYYRTVSRDAALVQQRRDFWTIVTFLFGPIGQIAYYYRHVKGRVSSASKV